jgi:hypothetical protein
VSVWAYRGDIALPQWKDVDTDNYSKLCSIVVDLKHLVPIADQYKKTGPDGTFYRLHYKLVLLFGLSELKAVFSWKENVSFGCEHGVHTATNGYRCRVSRRGLPPPSSTTRNDFKLHLHS